MYVYDLAYKNTEKYDPQGYAEGKYIPNDPKDFPNLFDANGKPLYNTNWEDEVYKPSWSTSNHLTLQGGTDKNTIQFIAWISGSKWYNDRIMVLNVILRDLLWITILINGLQ
jgi:hypothetical protein